MNVSSFKAKDYEKNDIFAVPQSKANSNPTCSEHACTEQGRSVEPISNLHRKAIPQFLSAIALCKGGLQFFALVIFGLMTGRIYLTYDESVLDDFYFIGAESLESGKLVSA